MQCLTFLYLFPDFLRAPSALAANNTEQEHSRTSTASKYHSASLLVLRVLRVLKVSRVLRVLMGLQQLSRLGRFESLECLEGLVSMECLEGVDNLECLERLERLERWSWAFGCFFRFLTNPPPLPQKHKNWTGKRHTFVLWLTVRIAI